MSSCVIGLTGGIACGKSNLSRALREEGARVMDADEVSHRLTAPGGKALPARREAFGDGVFRGDEVDREKLGEVVFRDAGQLKRLNAILHPMIFEEIRRELDSIPGVAVLEAPLLYECGLEKDCCEVWCAYIPQKEQIKRLRERNGLTRRQALERIRSQMSGLEKAKRADRVIRTDGTREESALKVKKLYRERIERIIDVSE